MVAMRRRRQRGGHGRDQVGLDAVGGVEALEVVFEELVELFLGLVGEHDGFGAEAVAEAVAGGDGFAFRGGGAVGFGSVGARGFGFEI